MDQRNAYAAGRALNLILEVVAALAVFCGVIAIVAAIVSGNALLALWGLVASVSGVAGIVGTHLVRAIFDIGDNTKIMREMAQYYLPDDHPLKNAGKARAARFGREPRTAPAPSMSQPRPT